MSPVSWSKPGNRMHSAYVGVVVVGRVFERLDGSWTAATAGPVLAGGFPPARRGSRRRAKEYIEACYALWIASGGGK